MATPLIKRTFFTEKESYEEILSHSILLSGKGVLKDDLISAGLGLPCRKGDCKVLPFYWDGANLMIRYEKDPDEVFNEFLDATSPLLSERDRREIEGLRDMAKSIMEKGDSKLNALITLLVITSVLSIYLLLVKKQIFLF